MQISVTMKRLCVSLFAGLLAVSAIAQKKSPVVLTIQNQKFGLDEFEYVYSKNNQLSQSPLSANEYLDLFVNYKLKVKEAQAQGIDTTESFKREFGYYKDELAKPYLNDKKTEESLMQEAYARLQQEVDASHILIRFPQGASPKDTLEAWNKTSDLQKKITEGADFSELAFESSEDPSAKQNRGRLGYFTGFQMVYPFESAAFNTPIGQVSGITRSAFGYHLIKVHDKRPARGEVLTAHIMKMFPYGSPEAAQASAKATIDSLYALILDGADFGTLARENSDDRNSAVNNGEMPWFSTGTMIPEFADPAFALTENGQISKPIKTPFGWHIIKRLDYRPVASFDEKKEEIAQRIQQDERAYAGQNAVVKQIKAEAKYQSYAAPIDALKKIVEQDAMTDSLFFVQAPKGSSLVFSFAKQNYTQAQFVDYLKTQPAFSVAKGTGEIDSQLEAYSKEQLINYKKERLMVQEPDYRFLVNEYHDGLLIFEISQKEIWNKAATDTIGLTTFFATNQSTYPKAEQWEGVIYYCDTQATQEKLKTVLSTDISANDSIISGFGLKATEVKTEKAKYFKGDKAIIDANFFNVANAQINYPQGFTTALTIGKINPAGLYELDEIRGQVLSDYQTELEKQWVESLKAKYKPIVNVKALKKLKTN
jgi:peptidyl-prolyl cis-trans isomerase SurA